MKDLSSNASRIQLFFERKGYEFEVVELSDSTRSAKEAAAAIGCEVAQIAKSLIFKDENTGDAILVVASGTNQVDLGKIQIAGEIKLGKADAAFVKEKTGFTIGGVPPAGHEKPLLTYIDEDLKNYDEIWAAAGSPFAVFKLVPDNLSQLTNGHWMNLRRE